MSSLAPSPLIAEPNPLAPPIAPILPNTPLQAHTKHNSTTLTPHLPLCPRSRRRPPLLHLLLVLGDSILLPLLPDSTFLAFLREKVVLEDMLWLREKRESAAQFGTGSEHSRGRSEVKAHLLPSRVVMRRLSTLGDGFVNKDVTDGRLPA